MTDNERKRQAESRLVNAENRLHEFERTLTGSVSNPYTARRRHRELQDEMRKAEEELRRLP